MVYWCTPGPITLKDRVDMPPKTKCFMSNNYWLIHLGLTVNKLHESCQSEISN